MCLFPINRAILNLIPRTSRERALLPPTAHVRERHLTKYKVSTSASSATRALAMREDPVGVIDALDTFATATGQGNLVMMSENRELELGEEEHQKVMQSMRVYDDEKINAYVRSIGERLAAVGGNLERLGLTAELACADAARPDAWWNGRPFDRILLDAPCSATGVIRRHPDIRLLRRASDIPALARRQRELLSGLWPLLAPGGRLLYVTCSVLSQENEAVMGEFLAQVPGAYEEQVLPNYNIRDVMSRRTCGFQVVPGVAGLDGFYYACLTKSK